MVEVQQVPSLFCCLDAFLGSLMFSIKFLGVFSPPDLGDPASFVEELPDDDHDVAEDVLGHPNSVDVDVGRSLSIF